MQYSEIEDGYMIHVEKGEKIMESITEFCKNHDIENQLGQWLALFLLTHLK